MNLYAVDRGLELVELVQTALVNPPVVLVAPVGHELPQVGQAGAVVPVRVGELVSKTRPGKALLQIGQHAVWNLDPEWRDRVGSV